MGAAIVEALAAQLGFEGALKPKRVTVLGGGYVQLDACSDDEPILAEAYERQGKLNGAQIKKISQDILKLALLKRDPRLSDSRAIAVFNRSGRGQSSSAVDTLKPTRHVCVESGLWSTGAVCAGSLRRSFEPPPSQ